MTGLDSDTFGKMRAASFVLACAALLSTGATACSSSREPSSRSESGKGAAPADVVRAAASFVQKDNRLAGSLAPRAAGHGWTAGVAHEGFVLADAQTGQAKGLDAKLGARACDAFRIEPRGSDDLAIVLHPEGASDAAGALSDGHVVYPSAFGPGVDRILTASPAAVEELLLLHDSSAPTRPRSTCHWSQLVTAA